MTTRRFDERTLVHFRDGRTLCAPIDAHSLQCVAQTVRGRRCENPIEFGQFVGPAELVWVGGTITVYDIQNHAEASARWLAQHCTTHDTDETVDFVAPEWEMFDPTGVHAALVKPLPTTPTRMA